MNPVSTLVITAEFVTVVALPVEVTSPVKFALVDETTPVNVDPSPANLVALNIPVLGTKDNLVLVTFCGKLPVLAVTNVG